MFSGRDVLNQLVGRIRSCTEPLDIILFGSGARGELGPHSDLDVLVVVPDGSNCRGIAKDIYRQTRGLGHAKDILVVQRSDCEQHGHNPYLVIHTALKEGIRLYHAPI